MPQQVANEPRQELRDHEERALRGRRAADGDLTAAPRVREQPGVLQAQRGEVGLLGQAVELPVPAQERGQIGGRRLVHAALEPCALF